MSGVYIKGMEMPVNCFLCHLSYMSGERLFCYLTKEEAVRAKRAAECPLVPVPPHGDLIERDAAYDKIAEQEGGNYVDMDAVDMGLNQTPVIIPAEEPTQKDGGQDDV